MWVLVVILVIQSKDEEARIKKEELDLKLAETAFDNFLQENDRLSMEAQKKYQNLTIISHQSRFLNL